MNDDMVGLFINIIANNLLLRTNIHNCESDISNIIFKYYDKVAETKTHDEYIKLLDTIRETKYTSGKHSKNIQNMTLIDIIELTCVLYTQSITHNTIDIFEYLNTHQQYIGYSDDLKYIIVNTIKKYFKC